MKNYFPIFAFLFSVFLFSCKTTGLKRADYNNLEIEKSAFQSSDFPLLYKTDIILFDNNFSGISVFKKTEIQTHRVVFMNEMGMKFFDLEIGSDTFFVHHIFKPMNKKALINMLVSDFRLMLFYGFDSQNYISYQNKQSNTFVIRPKAKSDFYYLLHDESNFSEIKRNSIFRNIIEIKYLNFKNLVPGNIVLKHKNINFEMAFSKM